MSSVFVRTRPEDARNASNRRSPLLLTDTGIEWKHTRYDLPAAAERVRATSYPQAAEFASSNVLNPPTEMAMLEALERSAIR